MSFLKYRCPNTGREITSGIDTEPKTLAKLRDLKVSVSCPHCVEGHRVAANEMFFATVDTSSAGSPSAVDKAGSQPVGAMIPPSSSALV
jgi:hypothetical protein